MAKKNILVSDLTGREIGDPKDSISIRFVYGDRRRGVVQVDAHVDDDVLLDIIQKGRQQARRGRKPKAEA